MTKVAGQALTLPPNFSIAAAISAGLLSNNTQVVTINGAAVAKGSTVATLMSTGVLTSSMPASALGFAGGPQFGGD